MECQSNVSSTCRFAYLITKALLPFIAACRACTKYGSLPLRAYRVLNLLTQLRDCNRRLLPLSQCPSTATQKAFPILGGFAGCCNPSSYPFAPFGSFPYFQAGLLIHKVNSLVLVLGTLRANKDRYYGTDSIRLKYLN